ncbi:MAG: hypothetical protein H6R19_1678 [Proteobacteria bacterium]|nr:hypothetical protein [Pseudomonadota bacterium]
MFRHTTIALAVLASSAAPMSAMAADSSDLQQIRQEIDQLRQGYEARIRELESRLQQAEKNADQARQTAVSTAEKVAASPVVAAPSAPAANGFNPDISLILSGQYANLSKDPEKWKMSNFIPGGDEIGPGKRGFNLGESELGFSASVDQLFRGQLTLSVTGDNSIEAEEGFVQSTSLPAGFQTTAGRFFSGIGYLNSQHSHTWDFVDAPLAYQAFLGGQFKQDGVQMKWVAPTSTFVELGADLGAGENFPGSTRNKNGAGATALFAHVGGDVGASHSWRAGAGWLRTAPRDRSYDAEDLAGNTVTNSFSGTSRLWLLDGVWKWAPNGNGERINLKLQGEYFRRHENGELAYDTASQNLTDSYRSAQSGWYLQSVFQFMPRWRVGARYDQLSPGRVDYASNEAYFVNTGYKPTRSTLMLDWSPSEFSRIRLQYAQDKAREGVRDDQIYLQYQMSLGAHGAHSF